MNIKKIFLRALILWFKHDALKESAAVSFFAMIALPSLLLVIVSLGSILFDPAILSFRVSEFVGQYTNTRIADVIHQILSKTPSFNVLQVNTIFGFLLLLFSGSSLVGQLQKSLNAIWQMPRQSGSLIKKYLRNRLLQVMVVFFLGALLLLVITAEVLLSYSSRYLSAYFTIFSGLQLASQLISFALLFVVLAVAYKYLPAGRPSTSSVVISAFFAAAVISIGKYIMNWYVTFGQTAVLYGAAGTLVSLYIWIFFSSLIVFFGAALIKAISDETGRPIVYYFK